MPYLMGAPLPGGGRPLLDVDFSTWSAGFFDASSFQAQNFIAPDKTKFNLLRDYTGFPTSSDGSSAGENHQGETVQTSESSLLRTASATQTDVACVGRNASARPFGLVIQPCHSTFAPDRLGGWTPNGTRDITTAAGWTGGVTFTTTTSYSDSPDGSATGCSHVEVTGSGYCPYGTNSGSSESNFSTWQRSKDAGNGNGDMRQTWSEGGSPTAFTDYVETTRSASDTWARLETVRTAGRSLTYADPAFHARDVLIDYTALTAGVYAVEVIPTAEGTRPAEKLRYQTGSQLIASTGQIKVYARLTPKHASADQTWAHDNVNSASVQTLWTLFEWGSSNTNYARIRTSDNKLAVKIASGTEYVSTNAISFAKYDLVELDVAVGNNVASVARYRINGGAWTDLALATVPDVPAPSTNEIRFFSNGLFVGASASWVAWIHRLTVGA